MTGVDLSALRMEQQPAMPKRPLGPRLLGGLVLLLAVVVALTFAWPLLRPVRAVPMVPVRTAGTEAAATMAMAEAAGWVEPDPFPIAVRPLVAGRIESIAVLEGATVRTGETILATLASAELVAAAERAAATLAERERELEAAMAAEAVATAQLEQLAAPRMAVAEARIEVADRQERLAAAQGAERQRRAEAVAAVAARQAQERLATAGGTYALALTRAQAAVAAAEAMAEAAAGEAAALTRELAATEQRLAIAEELLANPVELRGAATTAAAATARARAARDAAATERQITERELGQCDVKAPIDGVVLRLLAQPGTTVGPDGDGIMTLYRPDRLRARIDVPLGSIGGIHQGQAVELRSEVLGNTIVRGIVQRLQHESDLLKNTLQVKVGITDPPPLLRPETLCRARFLGDDTTAKTTTIVTFLVPTAAVQNDAVFVFDPAHGTARKVPVQLAGQSADGTLVRGELSVAQRVITAPVLDGERVRPEAP
ncbi:MAG: efflux RND transporter periplasmic adaptor subunit [Planctomycetes bacterium]|nr:efflux RND transporter periplasmic adaptor subunit [Planctomycetota bacterium]